MEHNETATGTVAAAPVVRQLDFTVNFKATPKPNANGSMILPEHPQAQLQSKLLALAQSRQVHAPARSPSPPRMAAQTKLPPRKMVRPPKSPQRELPPMSGQDKSPRLAHPVKLGATPKAFLKTESPKTRERGNLEQNDGTPKKQKQCNCKNSRCLKLYCECFATGVYCDGCNCTNCHNKIEHEADRKESINAILERNPNAFRPKIASSPQGAVERGVSKAEHKKGCNCKKSGCLKRYCECFQANIVCSDKCKCMDCKNYEGSEERNVHFRQYSANSIAVLQQAANAAINGALGTPVKKSRNQQIVFGSESNSKRVPPQYHQEISLTSDPPHSPSSIHPSKPDATSGLSKSSYRSPLSGILQLQHVKDFCTLLVEVSAEAANSRSEEAKMIDNGIDLNEAELPVTSSHEENKDGHQNQQNTIESCEIRDNRDRSSSSHSDRDIQNGRPLSPGTLALMCDERETVFMTANAQPTTTQSNTRPVSTHGPSTLYVEQERLVLTRFRNFLNKLITCGSIEETKIEHGAD